MNGWTLNDVLFSFTGNVVFANVAAARKLAQDLNELPGAEAETPEQKLAGQVNAGALFAMGMIDELSHALVAKYRREQDPAVMAAAVKWLGAQVTPAESERLLLRFVQQFPTVDVYRGKLTAEEWLKGDDGAGGRIARLRLRRCCCCGLRIAIRRLCRSSGCLMTSC